MAFETARIEVSKGADIVAVETCPLSHISVLNRPMKGRALSLRGS
jgi:hypothetical protein